MHHLIGLGLFIPTSVYVSITEYCKGDGVMDTRNELSIPYFFFKSKHESRATILSDKSYI